MDERTNWWTVTDGEWHTLPAPRGHQAARIGPYQWASANGYRMQSRASGPFGLEIRMTPRLTGAPCEAVREVLAGGAPNSPDLARLIDSVGEREALILFDTAHSPFGHVQRWAHRATVGRLVRAGLLCGAHVPPHLTPEGLRVVHGGV